MLDLFNTVSSGILAAGAGWAVMSPRVRVNLVMHVGLVLIAIGFLGLVLISLNPSTYQSATSAASAIVHIGLVLCAVGYAKRARQHGPRRRSSDWVDL